MTHVTKYDVRQYRQMMSQISAYEAGAVGLRVLISNLEALMDLLQAPETAWLDDFRRQWANLEIAYAVASDRGESLTAPNYVKSITDALEHMKRCLSSLELPQMDQD